MMNPEMMQAAQRMMANMKPDDMKRMSEMAANMDPKVMENMMKGMGGGANMPSQADMQKGLDQVKGMSADELRSGMDQAQRQMNSQKQYVYNGALNLKNEGNTAIKNEQYKEALASYGRALENLRPHGGFEDVRQLQVMLMTNSALCHIKQKEYKAAVDISNDALKINPKSVKAIFRRGLAHFEMSQLSEALADLKQASALSPEDDKIGAELRRVEFECREQGLKDEDVAKAEKAAKVAMEAAEKAPATPGLPTSLGPGMGAGPGGKPDMEQMSKVLEDPEMMKKVAEAAQHMPAGDDQEAEYMRKAAAELAANPELGKQMSDMMKNMPPEQMEKMMEMSSRMRSRGGATSSTTSPGGGGGAGGGPAMDQEAMDQFMNDPDTMKAAEEMMKNMSPEMLAGLAKSQGIELDESKAKMIGKLMPFIPWVMKAMRGFQKVKKGVKTMFSPTGRWIIAAVVLLAALYQHYWAS